MRPPLFSIADAVLAAVAALATAASTAAAVMAWLESMRVADALTFVGTPLPFVVRYSLSEVGLVLPGIVGAALVFLGLALRLLARQVIPSRGVLAVSIMLSLGFVALSAVGHATTRRLAEERACPDTFLCANDCECVRDAEGNVVEHHSDDDGDGEFDAHHRLRYDDGGALIETTTTFDDARSSQRCTFDPPCPQDAVGCPSHCAPLER